MQQDTEFRLSVNLPAQRRFFADRRIKAVHLEVVRSGHQPELRMRPALTVGRQTAAILPKHRGGFDVIVSGTAADELFTAFHRLASPTQPFFLLRPVHPEQPDTLQLSHHQDARAPSKYQPWVRFRVPRPRDPAMLLDSSVYEELGAFALRCVEARTLVNQYESTARGGQPGRPPEAVRRAREVLTQLAHLARQVLPELTCQPDTERTLRQTIEALQGLLPSATRGNVVALATGAARRGGGHDMAATPRDAAPRLPEPTRRRGFVVLPQQPADDPGPFSQTRRSA